MLKIFKPDVATAAPRDREATTVARLIGAAIALAVFGVLLALLLITASSLGAPESTVINLGEAFTYAGIGAFFIGWKWPHTVADPFSRRGKSLLTKAQGVITIRLPTPIQRGLFAVAVASPCPWLIARVIPEVWDSSGSGEYFRTVFYPVISTVLEVRTWGYGPAWYDWLVTVGIVCFGLAFTWPWTGARLGAWIRGANTDH